MITILMTTYNGEQYIAKQIESLLAQTEQDLFLALSMTTVQPIRRFSF